MKIITKDKFEEVQKENLELVQKFVTLQQQLIEFTRAAKRLEKKHKNQIWRFYHLTHF